MTFSTQITELARTTLEACRKSGLTIATAESCTGGLIAAALTEIAGSSDVVECGFVTYSNQAKYRMLGVPLENTNGPPGAVSALVAQLMVEGALERSGTDIGIAVTGIAGPGGGTKEKPVGLVYLAAKRKGGEVLVEECHFADRGRSTIREETTIKALHMLTALAASK